MFTDRYYILVNDLRKLKCNLIIIILINKKSFQMQCFKKKIQKLIQNHIFIDVNINKLSKYNIVS